MEPSPTASTLILGEFGGLPGRLSRRLRAAGAAEGAETVFFFCGPEPALPIASWLEAAAAPSRPLKRVLLVAVSPPSVDSLVAEDALRYLAAQRSASLTVLRVSPEAARTEAFESRLAALAAGGTAPGPEPVVLVTGAAGQIGRAMTRLLDERGIAHLDVGASASRTDASFLRCDLADPAALDRLAEFCRPVTHVIHLASRISSEKDMARDYRAQFRLNVDGASNLLTALPPTVRHVAFASSLTVYGDGGTVPVDERRALAPNCVYALCKLAVERRLAEFGARSGMAVALLRYASVYGPDPVPGRAIPEMIARVLAGRAPEVYGAGSALRDYVHVDDVCRATLQATLKEADGVFNIGTGRGTTTAQLAHLLARLSGTGVAPVFIPRAQDAQSGSSLVYDVTRMRRELDCVPEITLEEGLRRAITAATR